MAKVEIKSSENGPNLILLDGQVFTALCRCDGSKNKPAKISFKAPASE